MDKHDSLETPLYSYRPVASYTQYIMNSYFSKGKFKKKVGLHGAWGLWGSSPFAAFSARLQSSFKNGKDNLKFANSV